MERQISTNLQTNLHYFFNPKIFFSIRLLQNMYWLVNCSISDSTSNSDVVHYDQRIIFFSINKLIDFKKITICRQNSAFLHSN